MLVLNPITGNVQVTAFRQAVRKAAGRIQDDTGPLLAPHRSRPEGEDTWEEDALKWVSCVTWQRRQ